MSIRTRTMMICLLLGIAPALMMGTISWYSALDIAELSTREFQAIALNTGDKIDRNLFERYGDVQAFCMNTAAQNQQEWYVKDKHTTLKGAMNGYIDTYDVYYVTMLVDLDGDVIAVNDRDSDGKAIPTAALYGKNFAQAQWFKDCVNKRFLASKSSEMTGTVVEDVYVDSDIKSIFNDEGLVIGFSAPLKDARGETIGVWKNFARFSLVEDIFVATYSDYRERLKGMELTLLDREGNILIDYDPFSTGTEKIIRDMNIVKKLNPVNVGIEYAKNAISGKSGCISSAKHCRKDQNVSVGYGPTSGAFGFPGLGWGVLARVPTEQSLAGSNHLKAELGFGLLAMIAIVPALSLWFSGKITRPILKTVDTLSEMARGNLTLRMDESTKDEFAHLAVSFNQFADRIEKVIGEMSTSAVSLQGSSTNLSVTSERMSQGALDATTRSSSVAAAAEQMSMSISQMAGSTEEVSSNIREVSVAVEEMNSSISEVARSAEKSADVASHAANLAQISNQKIEDLGAAAGEIGKVIEVIQDIAEQTNLLALNATIEAARAGDAGKGFAVVATEVKELAKQTAAATDDIRRRIESIQATTTEAVTATKQIGEVIDNVNSVARTIAAAVEEQSITTKQIAMRISQTASAAECAARGAGESAEASREITQSITMVDGVLKETAAGATQSKAAGVQFGVLAANLQTIVGQFRTRKEPSDNGLAV